MTIYCRRMGSAPRHLARAGRAGERDAGEIRALEHCLADADASVIRVKNYEEALSVASDMSRGLSAGIATTSLKYATHFKRNSEAGMVMVNLPTAGVDFHVPFGGRKASSFGPRDALGAQRVKASPLSEVADLSKIAVSRSDRYWPLKWSRRPFGLCGSTELISFSRPMKIQWSPPPTLHQQPLRPDRIESLQQRGP